MHTYVDVDKNWMHTTLMAGSDTQPKFAGAGAIAELYRELGGEAIFYGKPHRPIYERAMALAAERRGRPTSLDRVLAIGDSVRTDLTGALGFGVDPYVVYEVRNTYMDIGWEQFLFDSGASPQAAFADPDGLGTRMAAAEKALRLERRLTLEARIQV